MLKHLPKHYNPPGNGKRDMESLAYINEQERAMLKMHGGMGKMTEHGVRSYYLGDKGNSVGSAGASDYSGDGKGGQVNMDHVGGKTGNVLRNIAGKWTIVDKASGSPVGNGQTQAPTPVKMAPVIRPVPTAIPQKPLAALPVGFAGPASSMSVANPSPQIGGVSVSSVAPGQRVTDVFGPSYAPDPSIAGRLAATRATPKASVPAGQRVTDVFGPSYARDPSIAGRLNAPQPANNVQAPASSPEAMARRIGAISRGPGSVAGVMPGASALSQQRTMQTLGNAMTEGGRPMSQSDVQNLSRTVFGEAGRESPMGQTAVANTMLNRMSLAADNPDKYGYMGGGDIKSLMAQYDATGPARAGGVPNRGFQNAVPGTDALGQGIASLAGAASPVSNFNRTASAKVKNATHFYNPNTSNPSWGGRDFAGLGNHVFGNAESTAAQVASLRANPPTPNNQTMVASASPMAGPPVSQSAPQSDVPTGSWMDMLPGAGYAKQAANYVDQTMVKPAQEQIAANGGFKSAGAKARMAVALMNLASGGPGANLGTGGKGGLGNMPRGAKPKAVEGPTEPKPGFTWVQWTPGSPPTQIPTNALIGVA